MSEAQGSTTPTAVVLDFGGPVLRTPFELLRVGERSVGLEPGTLDWSGPFDPSSDADWRLMQSGGITEREYWQRKADRFAELTGREATFQGLMDVLFSADEDELVRAGCGRARRRRAGRGGRGRRVHQRHAGLPRRGVGARG